MTSILPLDDEQLATALESALADGAAVDLLYHRDGYRFAILVSVSGRDTIGITGELSIKALRLLARFANKKALFGEGRLDRNDIIPARAEVRDFAIRAQASRKVLPFVEVENFYKTWKVKTEARASIPLSARNAVFARAGGCCEYRQCGEPLFKKDRKLGNWGYLAHIVGAIKGGPRGDYPADRDSLNSEDNILFLCDFHHRLIDRIEPDIHTVELLRAMRDESLRDRENYSEFRKKPLARILALSSDIMGVTTDINKSEAVDALWDAGFRSDSHLALSSHLGDRKGGNDERGVAYWDQFLDSARADISALIHALRGEGALGVTGQTLAVFALGNMPSLLLLGRILGEARSIRLFHRDRNRQSWAWPIEPVAPNPMSLQYSRGDDLSAQEEIVVTLDLTADVDGQNLPEPLRTLPRISLRPQRQGQDAVLSLDQLNAFRQLVQDAFNLAQDRLKAKTVHLITIAPAVTVVATGMKLQARNHARIVMYQAARNMVYFPALTFEGQKVYAGSTRMTVELA